MVGCTLIVNTLTDDTPSDTLGQLPPIGGQVQSRQDGSFMNEKLFVLAGQKKTTNHVLHLLLCIPTAGLWLIVWLLVASSNSKHNARIQNQMSHVLDYKMQGLSDVETYRRVGADEAANKLRSDQIFVFTVVAVAVGLFFLLK